MADKRDARIERLLGALSHDPPQASAALKQRLVQSLLEEQARRAAAPAFWRALLVPWPALPRRAYLAAGLLLLLIFSAILAWPADRALLQVQQGVVQVIDTPGLLPPWGRRPSLVNKQHDLQVTEGAAITLPADGAAVLSFFDRSQVELSPGTQMTLTQARPGSLWQPPAVRMQVETGEVRAQVSPLRSPAERFEITLPTALVSVRGTIFRAWVISATHTCIATDEGVVLVQLVDPAQGYPEIEVPAGYEVHAILGQPLVLQPQDTAHTELAIAAPTSEPIAAALPLPTAAPTPTVMATRPLTLAPTPTPPLPPTPSPAATPTPRPTPTVTATTIVTPEATPPRASAPAETNSTPEYTPPRIVPQADLALSQSGSPNPAAAAGKVTYTLTVYNNGPAAARQVVVSHTMPAEVMLITSTATSRQNAETLMWRLGTLAAGEERVLRIETQVRPWVTQTFTHTAWVSSATPDADAGNNRALGVTPVTTATNLAITRLEFPAIVGAGEVVTCLLEYTNLGPAVARSVSLAVTLAPNLRLGNTVSATPALRFIPAPPAGNGTLLIGDAQPQRWVLAELPAHESGRLIFTLKIAPGTLGWLTNTVTLSSAAPELQPADNRYRQTLWAARFADLALTRLETTGEIVTGDVLTYTLAYANRGPWAAENVIITGILPPGVTFGGMAAGEPGNAPTLGEAGLQWRVATLPAGAADTLVFTATAHRATAGSLLHIATIESATTEGRPGDENRSTVTRVRAPALHLEAALAPTQVAPRMPFTLTVWLTNTGDASFAAGALALTPTWPLSVTYLTPAATSPWTNTAPLTPGQSLSCTLTFSATDVITPGRYTGAVVVTGITPAGILTAGQQVTLTVATPAITLIQEATPVDAQEMETRTVAFTVTLVNAGPTPLTALPLQDFYPGDALRFVAAWPPPDAISPTGMLLWHDLLSPTLAGPETALAPGAALCVTVVFEAPPSVNLMTPLLHTLVITGGRDLYGNVPAPTHSQLILKVHRLHIPLILRRD